MWMGTTALGIPLLTQASQVDAQPTQRDSINTEQRKILQELARRFYWPDRRDESGVNACQVRFGATCVAEHLTYYGTQPVSMESGNPQPFRVVRPDSSGVLMAIPDRLIALADSARDNGWAIGQLAYLYSYGDTMERALEFVRSCRGNVSWCRAVHAFVLHSYSRYREADSLFAIALTEITTFIFYKRDWF